MATAVLLLDCNYEARHIMRVSVHEFESTLGGSRKLSKNKYLRLSAVSVLTAESLLVLYL